MTEASFDCVMNMLTHSLNGSLRLNSFSVFRVRGKFHVTRVLEMVNTHTHNYQQELKAREVEKDGAFVRMSLPSLI